MSDLKRVFVAACFMGVVAGAEAQSDHFSLEGPNGARYDLMRIHGSSTQPVTSVLIRRAGGSATLMDMMFDCASGQYLYLAMDHAPVLPVTDAALSQLAQYSNNILTTSLRAPVLTPITDDPYDAPMAALRDLVCGSS